MASNFSSINFDADLSSETHGKIEFQYPEEMDPTPVHSLSSEQSNPSVSTQLENDIIMDDLAIFLKNIDNENWKFFHGLFIFYGFTTEDILILKCCQLTSMVDTKYMLWAVRFWNKLSTYLSISKNLGEPHSSNSLIMNSYEKNSEICLKQILEWGQKVDMKGVNILMGLFNSPHCKNLSNNNRNELTNIIICFLNEHKIESKDEILANLAMQIQNKFKGETKETYFVSCIIGNKVIKKGKLKNRKYNINRSKQNQNENFNSDNTESTLVSLFGSICSGKISKCILY